jgi:type I restriction-modification system DNA methylase subunit
MKMTNSTIIKKQLGQFYTTNYEYILSNMKVPDKVETIIEPFVGNGDLLNFISKGNYELELYDIDPKITDTIKRDTLKNPPDYTGKFILTNPPYLARNKSKNKDIYEKYKCDDLYKCFILNIISNVAQGGIIIIPLNFLSSIRKADIELRKKFLQKYYVKNINIFEEQVFTDTSYAVCSICFVKKQNDEVNNIKCYIYPSKKEIHISLNSENNYTIGGEIYNLPQNSKYKVQRATKKTKGNITNILLKCIDDNVNSKLGFKIVSDEERFIDNTKKLSARSYATLVINKSITLEEQKRLVDKMNQYIREQREKYNSLFLTNYRDSNSIARKRISFCLAFKICNYILSSM